MREIDWSKAPKDATHAGHAGSNTCWYKHADGVWFYLYSDDYHNNSCGWADVMDEPSHTPMIKRITIWSGEGLPPVGTVCEAYGALTNEWVHVKIIDHQGSNGAAACRKLNDSLFWSCKFRPILSPEQIAAEEREKAIIDIARTIMPGTVCAGLEDMKRAEKLYDAGYRKQGEQR